MYKQQGWYACDLDGTLAHYEGWVAPDSIGAPIPAMVAKIKAHLAKGDIVKIYTARVFGLVAGYQDGKNPLYMDSKKAYYAIEEYCKEHLGQVLEITCMKDLGMIRCYDDRAIQIVENTGLTIFEAYTQGGILTEAGII